MWVAPLPLRPHRPTIGSSRAASVDTTSWRRSDRNSKRSALSSQRGHTVSASSCDPLPSAAVACSSLTAALWCLADGVDDDAEDEASLYSFDQLRRVIQASDAQLSAALHALFAYDIGGVYRTLHPGYQHALVTDVLNAVTETVQSPGDVDSTVLAQTLAHLYPPSLVIQTAQLLSPYTALSSSSSRHALCSQLLTRLHATRLFSESPSIPSPVLVAALTSHLPAPLVFDPAHLLGLALLMPSLPPQPPVYHWLPVWALAVDVRGRLADLFGIKERWTFEEMSGWLSDLCAVGEKVEALLMKHTRTVQDKDPHGVKRTLYVKR